MLDALFGHAPGLSCYEYIFLFLFLFPAAAVALDLFFSG